MEYLTCDRVVDGGQSALRKPGPSSLRDVKRFGIIFLGSDRRVLFVLRREVHGALPAGTLAVQIAKLLTHVVRDCGKCLAKVDAPGQQRVLRLNSHNTRSFAVCCYESWQLLARCVMVSV